jgi:hypothetical protein
MALFRRKLKQLLKKIDHMDSELVQGLPECQFRRNCLRRQRRPATLATNGPGAASTAVLMGAATGHNPRQFPLPHTAEC